MKAFTDRILDALAIALAPRLRVSIKAEIPMRRPAAATAQPVTQPRPLALDMVVDAAGAYVRAIGSCKNPDLSCEGERRDLVDSVRAALGRHGGVLASRELMALATEANRQAGGLPILFGPSRDEAALVLAVLSEAVDAHPTLSPICRRLRALLDPSAGGGS